MLLIGLARNNRGAGVRYATATTPDSWLHDGHIETAEATFGFKPETILLVRDDKVLDTWMKENKNDNGG